MADIGAPRRMLIVRERPTVLPAILEPLAEDTAERSAPVAGEGTVVPASTTDRERDHQHHATRG